MKKRIDTESSQVDAPSADATLFHRHLQLGWFTLLVFLSLGALLEALHGFKVDAYLNVAHETRRLMWTLAHAHGALFGVLHLAFAFTLRAIGAEASLRKASLCLIG